MAMQSEWTGTSQDAATYCVDQFNRVLRRLGELDPEVVTVFEPLPPGSSLIVAAMACKQVSAFFDDELGRGRPFGGRQFVFNGGPFKEFWRESAQDIEDLGDFIRESIDEWSRRKHRGRGCGPEPKPAQETEATSSE